MDYVSAFIVGGLICVIAQILMDRTKLTPVKNISYICNIRSYSWWFWYL